MSCRHLSQQPGERASLRFLEFLAANILNPHTRRAYSGAVSEFRARCEDNGVTSITAVQPLHVSAWIEQQTRKHAAPTAKLRLAAQLEFDAQAASAAGVFFSGWLLG